MPSDKLFTHRVMGAVCDVDCVLSAEERHLVMVFAWAADSRTGVGFSGRNRLAGMLGKTDRQVRRLIAQVNANPESPVRIESTPRFRKDGRGRTSDSYQLTLTNRTPASACSSESTGHPRPHEEPIQPDTHVRLDETTNRTSENVQPDIEGTFMRTSTSGHDPLRDPLSDPHRLREPKKARSRFVPGNWVPTEKHRELSKELGVDLDRELTSFREFEFKDPKSDWNLTFNRWLRSAHKFSAKPNKQTYAPQRGVAAHVVTNSKPSWEDS